MKKDYDNYNSIKIFNKETALWNNQAGINIEQDVGEEGTDR